MHTLQIFNSELALNRVSGKKQLLEKAITIFIKATKNRIELISNSISKNDYKTIRCEAHAIKGSALTIGAEQLGESARILEKSMQNNKVDDIPQLFLSVKDNYNGFIQTLSENGYQVI